jgi:hypothetical protein
MSELGKMTDEAVMGMLGPAREEDSLAALGPPRPGAKSKPLAPFCLGRELEDGDVPALAAPPPPVTPVQTLSRISSKHHELAALVARGMSDVEISVATGYSGAYLSTLRQDPSFAELVAYYRDQSEIAAVDGLKRLHQLGMSAVDELQKRVDENPDDWSNGSMMRLAELGIIKPLVAQARMAEAGREPTAPVTFNIHFGDEGGGGPEPLTVEGEAREVPPAEEGPEEGPEDA